MLHQQITAAPNWTVCDREIDISDIWLEEMDPENQDGASVTAYLHGNNFDDTMEIKGICIEDDTGRHYWDRERCTKYSGLLDGLWRAESLETQSSGDWSDDRYDEWKEAQ